MGAATFCRRLAEFSGIVQSRFIRFLQRLACFNARSCRDSNPRPFHHESDALPPSYSLSLSLIPTLSLPSLFLFLSFCLSLSPSHLIPHSLPPPLSVCLSVSPSLLFLLPPSLFLPPPPFLSVDCPLECKICQGRHALSPERTAFVMRSVFPLVPRTNQQFPASDQSREMPTEGVERLSVIGWNVGEEKQKKDLAVITWRFSPLTCRWTIVGVK